MAYETIKYEVEDHVLTITLNRPDKLNAFNGQMMFEMIDAFDKADADDEVRAIIVTGAGPRLLRGRRPLGGRQDLRLCRPRGPARETGYAR